MKKRDAQFITIVKCLEHLYKRVDTLDENVALIPQAMPYSETVRQEMMTIRSTCGTNVKKIKQYCKQYPPITKSQQTAHAQAIAWAKGKWTF